MIKKIAQNIVISILIYYSLMLLNFVMIVSFDSDVLMSDIVNSYKRALFNLSSTVFSVTLVFLFITVLRILVDYFHKKG
jgi:small-conductance mechanosensitive channel